MYTRRANTAGFHRWDIHRAERRRPENRLSISRIDRVVGQSWRNNKRLSSLFPPFVIFTVSREIYPRPRRGRTWNKTSANGRYLSLNTSSSALFGVYTRAINHSTSEFASRNDYSNALENRGCSFTRVVSLLGIYSLFPLSPPSVSFSIRFDSHFRRETVLG